jgi:hypothetical protein
MADGMGGLLANLMTGNPMGQLNQALAGPQPGQGAPAPAAGGGGQPGAAAPPGGPALPNAQATQSPPDLAQLYFKLERSQQLGDSLNRHMALMAGGFKGPPGGAQQIMQGMTGGGSQDPGALLQNLLQMRNTQAMQQAIPAMLQKAGIDPSYAPLAMANPDFLTKVVEAQTGVGADLDTRQYLAAQKAAQAAGQTFPDFDTWKSQHAAAGKQLGDYATEKANAIETFPSLDKTYGTAEQNINWLNAHPDALVAAVKFGPAPSKVYQAAVAAGQMNQETADARGYLDQLGDVNFRAGLSDVKNVRSQSEATKIGGSVTNVDKSQNSPDVILSEAGRLQDIAQAAHANLMAAAGKTVPNKYNGLVDSTYIDSKSPLYNGAQQEAPQPLPDDSLAKSKQLLTDHPEQREALVRHFRSLGYDTGKL